MKLRTGYLAKWKDEQGYGFIRSRKGKGREVFLHINALNQRHRRPQVGDVIHYQLAVDKKGRAYARYASLSRVRLKHVSKAAAIHDAQPNPSSKSVVRSFSLSLTLEVFLLALLPVLGSIHLVFTTSNPIPLILYPVMSWITYVLYAKDKSRAREREKGSRITEKTLHIYELMGGWIGAFVAQRRLHHKSRKVSYQRVFWTITLVHQLFWLGWFVFQGITHLS
jgi:uncharacterized membrane protein YsdA (DUF1294 family)/cold shock CspA family protein